MSHLPSCLAPIATAVATWCGARISALHPRLKEASRRCSHWISFVVRPGHLHKPLKNKHERSAMLALTRFSNSELLTIVPGLASSMWIVGRTVLQTMNCSKEFSVSNNVREGNCGRVRLIGRDSVILNCCQSCTFNRSKKLMDNDMNSCSRSLLKWWVPNNGKINLRLGIQKIDPFSSEMCFPKMKVIP